MPEQIRYFVPGPVYVLEEVRAAMLAPVVGHRSPEFMPVYKRITEALKPVFRTTRDVYLATSSATFLMEAALISLVERDVLHLTNGAFSERWLEIGAVARPRQRPDRGALGRDRRSGARSPGAAPQALRGGDRGPQRDLDRRGESARARSPAWCARSRDALLLVDAVSSLAGAPLETDAWGLDFVFAGVQKGLATPPGLTVFTFSERAEAQGRDDPASRLLRRPRCAIATSTARAGRSRRRRCRSAWALDARARAHRRRRDGGALGAPRRDAAPDRGLGGSARLHVRLGGQGPLARPSAACRPPAGLAARAPRRGARSGAVSRSAAVTASSESRRFASATWEKCKPHDLAALLAAIEEEIAA